MKMLLVLLQSFIANNTLQQILAPKSTKDAIVEKGVSVAIGGVIGLFASMFLVAGIVLLAIATGLQWDTHGTMELSGLMSSGIALVALSFVLILAVFIQQKSESKRQAEKTPPPADPWVNLVNTFLSEFIKELGNKKSATPASTEGET